MRQPLIPAPKSPSRCSFAGVAVSLLLLSAAFVVVFNDVDFSDAAFFQNEEKLGVSTEKSGVTNEKPGGDPIPSGYLLNEDMGSGQGHLIEVVRGDVATCAEKCNTDTQCAAFTHLTAKGFCRLKSAIENPQHSSGKMTYVKETYEKEHNHKSPPVTSEQDVGDEGPQDASDNQYSVQKEVDSSTDTLVPPNHVYYSSPVSPEEVKVGDNGPQDTSGALSENEDADRISDEQPVGDTMISMAIAASLVIGTQYDCTHVHFPANGEIHADAKSWTDETVKGFFGEIKDIYKDGENIAYTVINEEVTNGAEKMSVEELIKDQYTNHIDVDTVATPIAAVQPLLQDATHVTSAYVQQQAVSYGDGEPNPMTVFSAGMNVLLDKLAPGKEYAIWRFWGKQIVKVLSIAVNVSLFGTNPWIAGILAVLILIWSFAKEEFPDKGFHTQLQQRFADKQMKATELAALARQKMDESFIGVGMRWIKRMAPRVISFLYAGIGKVADLWTWFNNGRLEQSSFYLMVLTVAHGAKTGFNFVKAAASEHFCNFRGLFSMATLKAKTYATTNRALRAAEQWWNNKDHVDEYAHWNCKALCVYTLSTDASLTQRKVNHVITDENLKALQENFGVKRTCVSKPSENAFGQCCSDPDPELMSKGGLKELHQIQLHRKNDEAIICKMWAGCCDGPNKYDRSYYAILCCNNGVSAGATLKDITPRDKAEIPQEELEGLAEQITEVEKEGEQIDKYLKAHENGH